MIYAIFFMSHRLIEVPLIYKLMIPSRDQTIGYSLDGQTTLLKKVPKKFINKNLGSNSLLATGKK